MYMLQLLWLLYIAHKSKLEALKCYDCENTEGCSQALQEAMWEVDCQNLTYCFSAKSREPKTGRDAVQRYCATQQDEQVCKSPNSAVCSLCDSDFCNVHLLPDPLGVKQCYFCNRSLGECKDNHLQKIFCSFPHSSCIEFTQREHDEVIRLCVPTNNNHIEINCNKMQNTKNKCRICETDLCNNHYDLASLPTTPPIPSASKQPTVIIIFFLIEAISIAVIVSLNS